MDVVKQVIVVRKDLNMRKGKLASQVAHASMKVLLDCMFEEEFQDKFDNTFKRYTIELISSAPMYQWLEGSFTKIVVYVNSEEELLEIYEKAKEKTGLVPSAIIQDLGKTEFHGEPTYTALAVGPSRGEWVDEITGDLPLL